MTGWDGNLPPGKDTTRGYWSLSSGRMSVLGEPMVPRGFMPTSPWRRGCPAGIRGVCHQRKRRGWKPLPAPHDDLVKRQFSPPLRTGCGFVTSLSIGRETGGCIARQSSTPTPAWWSAGRLGIICGQNLLWMPWRWRVGNVNQPPERLFTRTGERNTPPEFLVTDCVRQDCSDRRGKLLPVLITP